MSIEHEHKLEDADDCELCAALDTLEEAVRCYCQTMGCTCERPIVSVSIEGVGAVEIVESHDPGCQRTWHPSRN